jgi:adenosylmethionine-8-amino-7-oxononanoate aminotransferase
MSTLWHPFTPMQDWDRTPQLSIERAEGNYLLDSEGRSYLDGVSSLWTNVHGHNHPRLNQAIIDQVHKVSHTTLLGLANPVATQLAEELAQVAPEGLEHVFFSDSGSTAVEIALKQAFQYWQLVDRPEKRSFVHLEQAYHGDTLGAVAVGGIDLFHQIFGPLLIDTLSIPAPHPYRHPRASTPSQAKEDSLNALKSLFEARSASIAALVMEPLVQGAGGILVHPEGFLSGVADLCREFDVLLIVDEVATGFGRTGTLFACEHEGVSPDLLCLAKGITGGYLPLAATLSTSKIYDAFLAPRHEGKTFFHGHSYTGNALACAVALENLAIFRDEKTIDSLQPKISHLRQKLAQLAENPNIGNLRQRGVMVGIELVADPATAKAFPSEEGIGHQVCMAARAQSVIIRNLGDVLVLMPPLSITLEELDKLVSVVESSIQQICA